MAAPCELSSLRLSPPARAEKFESCRARQLPSAIAFTHNPASDRGSERPSGSWLPELAVRSGPPRTLVSEELEEGVIRELVTWRPLKLEMRKRCGPSSRFVRRLAPVARPHRCLASCSASERPKPDNR